MTLRDLMERSLHPGPEAPPSEKSDALADVNPSYFLMPESREATEPPSNGSTSELPPEILEADADPRNRFGPFTLVAQVGSGGSGTVYRAWDRRHHRDAGLKILHTMEPNALERFTREARIAGNLQHPSIATVYEVGEIGGRSYIAMKYIDGLPIDALQRSIERTLELVRDACRALDYAHAQGIVHRDIKPANLLVDKEGRVYLTDFGIAKEVNHDQTTSLSVTGTILGTPKYLPPEQARGDAKRADARSDVYSIGATLYKLLAGQAPFTSSNVWETIESVLKRDPPTLTSLNASVSPELERVVARAMAKQPADRFASAGELADELDRLLIERRYSGRYGLPLRLARKWGPIAVGAVAVGLLIAWAAPVFFANPIERSESSDELYQMAARSLLSIEQGHDKIMAPDRNRRIAKFVTPTVDFLGSGQTRQLHARVLRARALVVNGDVKEARDHLSGLAGSDAVDYRIRFLRALLDLEEALSAPPPLPAPESPARNWDGPPPEFPAQLLEEFQQVDRPLVESILSEEHGRDLAAARALQPLIQGQWGRAAEMLEELVRNQRLAVYIKAWRRAAYLSRGFDALIREGSTESPEWFGAKLALALEADRPEDDLAGLRALAAGEPRRELTLLAWAARRSVDRGIDPAPLVTEGLALAPSPDPVVDELRGVLQIARLRRQSLAAADSEADYEQAQKLLGQRPSTWMGRLAAIEALVGVGTRRRLRGGDHRTPLDEAIKRSDDLTSGHASWTAPQVLRGTALLRLGRIEAALTDLRDLQDIRANLASSAALLRLADQARRARAPFEAHLVRAVEFADRVTDRIEDHAEALNLKAAAALFAAESAKEPAKQLTEAVALLDKALERIPNYVEARYHRAAALFLLAESGDSSGPTRKNVALADLDAALAAVPVLAAARALRGIIRCSIGKYGEALEDLKLALKQGDAVDPQELKAWIRMAEAAKER